MVPSTRSRSPGSALPGTGCWRGRCALAELLPRGCDARSHRASAGLSTGLLRGWAGPKSPSRALLLLLLQQHLAARSLPRSG